jgi:predicted TIM-barrel fold metal-dependent hydrolase
MSFRRIAGAISISWSRTNRELVVPDGIAWDTHAHVIGDPDRFPLSPGRGYTPAAASLDDYLAMLDRYGIARGVLVQPSVYGHDNRCLLDALDRSGGRVRGVVVPPHDTTTQDLEAMHERGVRAIRCNLINPGGLSPAIVMGWQPALRAMGWHVELHVPVDELTSWVQIVESFDVPVVVDHMGRPTPGSVDPSSPALARLISMVGAGQCFVKLSAPYRLSRRRAARYGGQATAPQGSVRSEPRSVTPSAVVGREPTGPQGSERSEPRSVTPSAGVGPRATGRKWTELIPLARAFLDANPSACLWGTDWPHVDTPLVVDTRDVIAALDDWCGDRWTRRQVTTDAAERLYGPGPP